MADPQSDDIPRPRLRLAQQQDGFSCYIGPFYEMPVGSTMRRVLPIDNRHLNPEGVVHGGVLSTFADFVLYRAIGDSLGENQGFTTIQLNVNYLAAVRSGQWLYGEGLVLRRTRAVIFASGELFTDERPVVAMTGIWKVIGR